MGNRFFFLFLRNILYFAQHDFTSVRRLGSQQILFFLRQLLIEPGIQNRDDASRLIPAVQRLVVQRVKELIHIVNPRRFHENAVVAAHAHRDQFCAEPSAVCLFVASAGNHLQLALIAAQLLQKQHIHIDCPKIILQDADVLSLCHQILCVLFQKSRLP